MTHLSPSTILKNVSKESFYKYLKTQDQATLQRLLWEFKQQEAPDLDPKFTMLQEELASRKEASKQSLINKYSHIHEYDPDDEETGDARAEQFHRALQSFQNDYLYQAPSWEWMCHLFFKRK